MSLTALVIDTSYLCELLKVPGRFNPAFSEAVKQRFSESVAAGHRLYVPFPVVFELANHIALVSDGSERKRQADRLAATVRSCIEDATPWIITPTAEEILYDLSGSVTCTPESWRCRESGSATPPSSKRAAGSRRSTTSPTTGSTSGPGTEH
ncbi:MAG: hypothetical protein JXB05_36865 [Myxococcaceae bacterium]|nr:hypothetical protein [Myxococcaceae bacterium]